MAQCSRMGGTDLSDRLRAVIAGQLYRNGRRTTEPVDASRIEGSTAADDTFVWLDATDPSDDDLAMLAEALGLHPLTLEDVRHGRQRPKVELFKDYAFVVLRPLALTADGLSESEIHALVGKRYLVTLRTGTPYPMEESVRRWERQPELLTLGGGFAVYVLVDEVVDDYLTMVEAFEDRADALEDDIFDDEDRPDDRELQERLFRLKRETIRLRRVAMPLRQGVDLLQEEPEFSPPAVVPYLRDLMDHVIRVVELADNVRDLLTSLLEVRIAQAANRMNEVMKSLTAWATILLVPTLLAGVWGMNFKHMPELNLRYGYLIALGSILASALGLFAWFKWKKRWL